jgi:hypothetical protein
MSKYKQRRNRNIPSKDFESLRNALFDAQVVQKSFWAGRAVAWHDVGIVTGLRPIEWKTVVWTDAEMTVLRVTNAKVKLDVPGFLRKGKSNRTTETPKSNAVPKTRDIPIQASDRQLVIRHLAMIEQSEMLGIDFATYHKQVSQAIRRACRSIWDGQKKYTLYSLRRQFAANAADAYGVEVSSQMMGHSNPQNPAAAAYGLACQAYARVGKGVQKRQKQSYAQQAAGDKVVQRSPAPCKFLAYKAAKMAQEQVSERCRF